MSRKRLIYGYIVGRKNERRLSAKRVTGTSSSCYFQSYKLATWWWTLVSLAPLMSDINPLTPVDDKNSYHLLYLILHRSTYWIDYLLFVEFDSWWSIISVHSSWILNLFLHSIDVFCMRFNVWLVFFCTHQESVRQTNCWISVMKVFLSVVPIFLTLVVH